MSEFISCFACDKEPTQQCPRCGRPYCDDHGEELCDACLEPASGVPSFTLYRGSLLALLVGTALAVWLLVQPGNTDSEVNRPQVLTSPTAAVASGSTQTPGTSVPGGATQPAGTPATRPAGTTTPATGGTPGASTSYTVVAGDTLGGICEKTKPASMTVGDCVAQIVSLNNLNSQDTTISVGQQLRVPAR